MKNCWDCGEEMAEQKLHAYTVETGYDPQKSPPLSYKEVQLCIECLDKQKKKEKFKKTASGIVLFIVIFCIILGFYILYTSP